ncbi:MAG: NUDIX domain-containing protein [Alphaproteobacteria bacterium]|nr:NUDIX domain-containing protein [Alphaproteobacteria bacterium]
MIIKDLLSRFYHSSSRGFFLILSIICISIIIGWVFGSRDSLNTLSREETWQSMNPALREKALPYALIYSSWDGVSKEVARKTLAEHLNKSEIPDGDLSVGSRKSDGGPYSGRYIISKWQRVAAGAIIVVLSENQKGELHVVLGNHYNKLSIPQGYMEANLPEDNLSGFKKNNVSRMRGCNEDFVNADQTLEDTAVREVWDEMGIQIKKKDLSLLDVVSEKYVNPVVQTIFSVYGIKIDHMSEVRTVDLEFREEDMVNPQWFKVSDIKCQNNKCHVTGSSIPLKVSSIDMIQKSIRKLANPEQLEECKEFLAVQVRN